MTAGGLLLSLILLMRGNVGSDTAELLHAPLNGIPGILPVSILVSVIKLITEPGYILLNPVHILFHYGKDKRRKRRDILFRQTASGSLHQISEMMQAKALAVSDHVHKIRFLFIQMEKGVKIPVKGILHIIPHIAALIHGHTP